MKSPKSTTSSSSPSPNKILKKNVKYEDIALKRMGISSPSSSSSSSLKSNINNNYTYDDTELIQVWLTLDNNNNDNNDDNNDSTNRIIGIKINSFIKFIKVLLGFPFVIVVSSLNLSSKINIILRSVYTIRLMNILMYGLPLILVYLGIVIIIIIKK